MMPRLTTINAGLVIGRSDQTIRRHHKAGNIKAEREGPGGQLWIDIDELREFAEKFNYRYREDLAKQLAVN